MNSRFTMPDSLVDALACFRLVRLVVDDKVTDRMRQRIWNRHPVDHGVGYALSCPYCAAVWISVLVIAARKVSPGLWQPAAEALALAAVAGEAAAAAARAQR